MSIEVTRENRVLHITLNRPEKRNALNGALCHALVGAFDEADSDPNIGSVLLSANGPAFCAGMDLSETEDFADIHERLFTTINRVDKPIVAAVQGAVLAGGTGLAANAHVVVASLDARFGLVEIRIGLWPVLVFRAVSLAIGERRATELSITGRILSVDEARAWSLVTEIHDDPLEASTRNRRNRGFLQRECHAEGPGIRAGYPRNGLGGGGPIGKNDPRRPAEPRRFQEGGKA